MWYVYADPGGIGCIGVRARPGGTVFDAFEHPGDDEIELLALAEERNSPMRVETSTKSLAATPESYPANPTGCRDALRGAEFWGPPPPTPSDAPSGRPLTHRSRTSRPPSTVAGRRARRRAPTGGLRDSQRVSSCSSCRSEAHLQAPDFSARALFRSRCRSRRAA